MHRLARHCHVLVENYRVGVTRRLGIDEPTLRAINPGLLYVSLSSQGQTGPEAASCCTGVVAVTDGTVVNDLTVPKDRYGGRERTGGVVAIGHPSGIMEVRAATHDDGGRCVVDRAAFDRTTRPIMWGETYVRASDVAGLAAAIAATEPTRAGVPSTTSEVASG